MSVVDVLVHVLVVTMELEDGEAAGIPSSDCGRTRPEF